tara:strand:- start:6229 stop:7371 length:1143 start_codon:yes stop_codon:yes gene_type:complete
MWDIQLFKLNFDERELKAAEKVISSGWLTMGENTRKFEENFSSFLGNDAKCTSVSSCTAALHMALIALGIKSGDEVVIPALTFVANINVVKMVDATPVLADCKNSKDWNVSLESVSKAITEKTKAVIIVHYAGYPCSDIEEISALCKKNNIHLIEDVAHAPGATIKNKKCGLWGDIGCFSFFSNKNLSVGEGGMVSTNSAELDNKIKFIRSHGMSSLTLDRHKGRTVSYDVLSPGLNYRIDEIRAAIGIVQLDKLSEANSKRKKLTKMYRDNFLNTDFLIPFQNLPNDMESAFHILPIRLPFSYDRSEVIDFLKKKRIQSSIHYPPFWSFSAFKDMFEPEDTPNFKEFAMSQLTLPLYPTMTYEEVDKVSNALKEFVDGS